MLRSALTLQEGFHGSAVGHVDWSSSGVGSEGGVGAGGQQEANHLHVVVLHGVVQRPDEKQLPQTTSVQSPVFIPLLYTKLLHKAETERLWGSKFGNL